jgi:hypothetical protein
LFPAFRHPRLRNSLVRVRGDKAFKEGGEHARIGHGLSECRIKAAHIRAISNDDIRPGGPCARCERAKENKEE